MLGESRSTKILDFNKGNGLFMSGEKKFYSLTETIRLFTLFSWGFKYYGQWTQRMANNWF